MKKIIYLSVLFLLFETLVNAQVTITRSGNMTISSGTTLKVVGDMTLKSDATGSASLLDKNQTNSVAVGGIAKSELYISANAWHYLSSSYSNVNKTEFTITPSGYANPNFYGYDETVASQWDNATMTYQTGDLHGWVRPGEAQMIEGKGYAYYLTSNYMHELTGGTFNSGDLDVTLTNTNNALIDAQYEGWNLVGNPYPTAMNWDLIYAGVSVPDRLLISNEVHFWTGDDDFKYADYNSGVGTNGGTAIIPAMQSFMVKCTNVNGSYTLTLPNSAKIWNQSQNYYKSNLQINDRLIKLKSTKKDKPSYSDETVLRFTDLAKNEYLGDNYDAMKLPSGNKNIPNIYTYSLDEIPLSINSWADFDDYLKIPLAFSSGTEGDFEISITENSIRSHDIYLYDSTLKSYHDFTLNATYGFYSPDNQSSSYMANRFFLVFTKDGITEIEKTNPTQFEVFSSADRVYIKSNADQTYSVELCDVNGRIVYRENQISDSDYNFHVNVNRGFYIVRVINQDIVENYKLLISNK